MKAEHRFTMEELNRFFDWLSRKYNISEDTFYTYGEDFCNARESEWAEIMESYGHKWGAE